MYTQCGQCRTTHRVSAKTLAQAYGRVRCMHCGAVFNALDALADELGKDGRFPPQFHTEQPAPLEGQKSNFQPLTDSVGQATTRIRRPEPKPKPRGGWLIGTGLLSLSLLLQIAYVERSSLSQHSLLQPLYQQLCGWIECQTQSSQAIELLALVNRDVRPHPDIGSALLISATVHNRAGFAQPYPQIGVTLRNLENEVVAERFFDPHEYLEADRRSPEGLTVDTLLPVEFAVADPGRNAVAFEFSFRPVIL